MITIKLHTIFHTLSLQQTASVAALVSGVLSVIATSFIASCIMWYVVLRRKQKRKDTSPGVQQGEQQQMGTPSVEPVEYEVSVFNTQDIQSVTTQDNVLQQNVA